MERYDKYLVFKSSDIDKGLTDKEIMQLGHIHAKLLRYRQKVGKKIVRDYVVVSESLPFYEEVWKMIENHVDNKVGEKQNGEEDGQETKKAGGS